MAYTTVNKSTDYFNTVLYTGNGSTQSITGVGFQPDMTWGKARSTTTNNVIQTSVQGLSTAIFPNLGNAESTGLSNGITSFDSDGFSLGDWSPLNASSQTFVSWNWRAGAGAGSSNTDGSINTTSTSVNTTAGFSISKYTGTGSNATIGHGLGAAPGWIIVKRLDSSSTWRIFHRSLGATKNIAFDNGNPLTQSVIWNDTAPTSSVFSVGTAGDTNNSSSTFVAYCWAEKNGYSKFGKYIGNGNDNGTFVYTGFKPAFVLIKNTTTSGEWWVINDSGRNPINIVDKDLFPNVSNAEAVHSRQDFLSNGFKFRSTANNSNKSGDTYIYAAFAEEPLVGSNNTPATAR